MNDAMLELRDLCVTYPRSRRTPPVQAVRDVSLTIRRGSTLGLVGESGSGKTSLGSAILGLTPVSAGSVHLDGVDITHLRGRNRRFLGTRLRAVFQDPYGSMNPLRRVGDTIGEGLDGSVPSIRAAVVEALEAVGLPPSAGERYPRDFSGGQRQRIAIARALVVSPSFLVCDEPVSALDLSVQAQILNLLGRLQRERGLTMLFISHDLAVVRHLSDEIAVMYAGRIVERGTAEAVSTAPEHPYTQLLMAAAPVPDPEAQARNRARRAELRARAVHAAATGA
ncbi:MAG: peptide transporter ATP-binding protein [Nocardioidaceae bacterium]|nr:peptide transporter ATP-binding protein [Nocardioidaceae bacterium]